jgi:hypothetical protein
MRWLAGALVAVAPAAVVGQSDYPPLELPARFQVLRSSDGAAEATSECFANLRGGLEFPLAFSVFGSGARGEKVGPGLGLGVGCPVARRMVSGLGFDSFYTGNRMLHHLLGSVGFRTPIGSGRSWLTLHVDAGIAVMRTVGSVAPVLPGVGGGRVFDDTRPTFGVGARLAWPWTAGVSWFLDASVRTTFLNVVDSSGHTGATGYTTLPVMFGLELLLGRRGRPSDR